MANAKLTLTPEQIKLGALYLAMSNLTTLDKYRRQIKDLETLKQYTAAAQDDAILGYMESGDDGYDERRESEAIKGVEEEIRPFHNDLRAGGKKAAYWVEKLKKELPFLFKEAA